MITLCEADNVFVSCRGRVGATRSSGAAAEEEGADTADTDHVTSSVAEVQIFSIRQPSFIKTQSF